MPPNPFLSGVIEGFYGKPWTPGERRQLLGWLQRAGLNAYLHGPKDDLKHRALWRAPYTDEELAALREIIRDCDAHGITYIHALAPGLDIRFSDPADFDALLDKLEALAGLGVTTFALLFDDIPARLNAADQARFGTPAAAQAWLANEVLARLRTMIPFPRLLFCPTVYCGEMARPSVAEDPYLRELGAKLAPAIDVFWTGPHIVSETLPVDHLEEVAAVLGRAPVIWDNLHANDYDMRRLYLGPYAGRPPNLREHTAGVMINPNCQFAANFMAVHSLGRFLRRPELPIEENYRRTLEEWVETFEPAAGERMTFEELKDLADLLYLPGGFGEAARRFFADLETVRRQPPESWAGADGRLEEWAWQMEAVCDKRTKLADRGLAHALYAHVWELKEIGQFIGDWLAWR
ncbi:MAG: hypothetical protein D6766_02115, partial [Verrucomicrobia bacterium]